VAVTCRLLCSALPFPCRSSILSRNPAKEAGARGARWKVLIVTSVAVCTALLRAVRAWLSPWIALQRWWTAWSKAPPPPPLQALISSVGAGYGLHLYIPN
jgi:hypothetical protein